MDGNSILSAQEEVTHPFSHSVYNTLPMKLIGNGILTQLLGIGLQTHLSLAMWKLKIMILYIIQEATESFMIFPTTKKSKRLPEKSMKKEELSQVFAMEP